MHLLAKQAVYSVTKVFIAQMSPYQVLRHVSMARIQTLWDKQNAISVQQEIFVHLRHKESSHARMGLTVKMGHLSALSAQVDTAVLMQVQIQFSAKMAPMHHQEALLVCHAHRAPSV